MHVAERRRHGKAHPCKAAQSERPEVLCQRVQRWSASRQQRCNELQCHSGCNCRTASVAELYKQPIAELQPEELLPFGGPHTVEQQFQAGDCVGAQSGTDAEPKPW